MKLKDKVAIVTGAGRGIGLAIARRFAEEGAKVALGDIDRKAVEENARQIAREGGHALGVRVDVARKAELERFVERTIRTFGPVDILVNNAAYQPRQSSFFEIPEAEWDRIIDVNLKGPFLLSQLVARQMVGRGGVIINLASVNSVVAHPDLVPYAASKGGISMLTKGMAVALAPYGIRVVAIGPGTIQTAATADLLKDPEALARVLSRTPLGRIGRPEEIAAVAAFLASDEAGYMTGTTVYVDGGRLALNGVMPIPAKRPRRVRG